MLLAAAILLGAAAGRAAGPPSRGFGETGQGLEASDAARALRGAIDIQVHNLPDDRPRSIDAIDVGKLASARGMRAIVLKSHYESTAGIAYLVRRVVPGIEVFG